MRMNKVKSLVLLPMLALCGVAQAKIDLVTVPTRDKVQVTIYNSADLTLVREQRQLTLRKGVNRLQFSWSNTLIDPTSLSMRPVARAGAIDVTDLRFPPRVKELGLWTIDSGVEGQNPMEITYLTSGLSWRAFYMGTLSEDESSMRLQGYVNVTNKSGEDYERAQTRLVVGKVNLIDRIAELAAQEQAYGRPGRPEIVTALGETEAVTRLSYGFAGKRIALNGALMDAKEIRKEGLSEYFVYTIEGEETIPHGWSKRLPSFAVDEVPVLNLYKYDDAQFGASTVRFLSFKNDEAHQLGDTPIPGGALKVYRNVDAAQHLAYEGQSSFKYIPMGEEVELNMGAVANVSVVPTLMDIQTQEYVFDNKGNINGWDEVQRWKLDLRNTREVRAKIQVDRHFSRPEWRLQSEGVAHKKIDVDTVRYVSELGPRSKQEIVYTLTLRHGERANQQ